jgi:hypothetical protein
LYLFNGNLKFCGQIWLTAKPKPLQSGRSFPAEFEVRIVNSPRLLSLEMLLSRWRSQMSYQTHQQSSEIPVFSTKILSNQAENMIKMTTRVHSKFVETGKEVQKETLDFFQNRFEKDVKFASEIMKLNQPGEVMSFYMAFFQEALDDYSREVLKLGHFGAQIAQSAKSDVTEAVQAEMQSASEAFDHAAPMNEQYVEAAPMHDTHQEFAPAPDQYGNTVPFNDQYGNPVQQNFEGDQSHNTNNGDGSQFSQPYTH